MTVCLTCVYVHMYILMAAWKISYYMYMYLFMYVLNVVTQKRIRTNYLHIEFTAIVVPTKSDSDVFFLFTMLSGAYN